MHNVIVQVHGTLTPRKSPVRIVGRAERADHIRMAGHPQNSRESCTYGLRDGGLCGVTGTSGDMRVLGNVVWPCLAWRPQHVRMPVNCHSITTTDAASEWRMHTSYAWWCIPSLTLRHSQPRPRHSQPRPRHSQPVPATPVAVPPPRQYWHPSCKRSVSGG